MERVHWDANWDVSMIELYNSEAGDFNEPTDDFWSQTLPYAIGVQCSSLRWNETIAPLANQTTVRAYFDAIYNHLHTKIDCCNPQIKRRLLKKFRRIRNKQNRYAMIHKFMNGGLIWLDLLGEATIYCGWNLCVSESVWNFPFTL